MKLLKLLFPAGLMSALLTFSFAPLSENKIAQAKV